MHKTGVVLDLALEAHHDPAIAQQPAIQPINLPTLLGVPQQPTIVRRRLCTIASVQYNQLNHRIQRVRVVNPVPNQMLGSIHHTTSCKRGFHKSGFMRHRTRYGNDDRQAGAICTGYNLAPFAARGLADFDDSDSRKATGKTRPCSPYRAKSCRRCHPLVGRYKCTIYAALRQVDPAAGIRVFGKGIEYLDAQASSGLRLERPMVGQAGQVSTWHVDIDITDAPDQEDTTHLIAWMAVWSVSDIGPMRRRGEKRDDAMPRFAHLVRAVMVYCKLDDI